MAPASSCTSPSHTPELPLPRTLFRQAAGLRGDSGARHLIETCGLPIADVELGEAARYDVDTVEAIRAAGGILKG